MTTLWCSCGESLLFSALSHLKLPQDLSLAFVTGERDEGLEGMAARLLRAQAQQLG